MGILSNTVSVCQYQVLGEVPADNFFAWSGECLAANAFHPIEQTSEELSVGWVHLADPKEQDFSSDQVFRRDHYLIFSLRRDQRRVPAALMRAHLEQAQNDFLAAHPGLQRVGKQKKEELREAVRGALLARTLPIPAVYDAVWDTRSNLLTFTSLSPKVTELFEGLFKQTFKGLRLVALHPMARAAQVIPEALRPALQQANRATTEAVLEQIQQNAWLGSDFLRWLLYQTLESPSTYQVNQPGPAAGGEPFVATLNDRLVLLGGAEGGLQKITVAGPQDHFGEVRAALQHDKQIIEANLTMEKQEHAWKMTFKAGLFHFAGYKAPAVKLEKDAITNADSEKEALFYERMFVLEEGLQLFDSLLATFLERRLGDWAVIEKDISEWLEQA
ncbi:recombination-associated protein RdgC [Desulfuromonas sp. KJ2020]|uniref:recombination-associated protein RdgC n=1 Tax=Desulfuromonas sp. KJ2020 TaxID=2919173 RepID=UPI0020A80148|nr:recombination-associated protein RdgC [Desulfuromonas sp. KJ2020]MCP3176468.1 recombination-associated protein RdgC [Desulfuromonas sp. KJ2020]